MKELKQEILFKIDQLKVKNMKDPQNASLNEDDLCLLLLACLMEEESHDNRTTAK